MPVQKELTGCLLYTSVKHNGDTGHEEQEEYHPELLDAFLTAPCLPEESDDSQYEGETICLLYTSRFSEMFTCRGSRFGSLSVNLFV